MRLTTLLFGWFIASTQRHRQYVSANFSFCDSGGVICCNSFVDALVFCVDKIISSPDIGTLTSNFPGQMAFVIIFLCRLFWQSAEYSCVAGIVLLFDIKGKSFNILLLSMMLAVGVHIWPLLS